MTCWHAVDFTMPPGAEAFRAELRAFFDAHLTPEIVAAGRGGAHADDDFEIVRAWNRTTADAGFAAISWPVEYGGRGAGPLEQVVHAEESARAAAPTHVNVIGMNNIAPAIMTYGTEQQKTELLPRMRRADDVWCQGMSEPEAGSDLASLRCRAVRDGDDFVVNGQKIWTSVAHRANWCELFVRTDPNTAKHKGISCLLVDMTSPGSRCVRCRRSLASLTSTRCSSTTCGCRRPRCSARSTRAGALRQPRWLTSVPAPPACTRGCMSGCASWLAISRRAWSTACRLSTIPRCSAASANCARQPIARVAVRPRRFGRPARR